MVLVCLHVVAIISDVFRSNTNTLIIYHVITMCRYLSWESWLSRCFAHRATTRGPIGPKNDAKVPYFEADLGVGSRFGPMRSQKRSKSKILFSGKGVSVCPSMVKTDFLPIWSPFPTLLCSWQLEVLTTASPWQLIWQLANDSWWQLVLDSWWKLAMTDDITACSWLLMTVCLW